MTSHSRFVSTTLAPLCLCALLAFIPACNRGKSQPGATNSQSGVKRYALEGTVVSIDKNAGTANIDNEPVAGFMDKMVMSYPLKPATALDQLQPGDSISADVVVTGEKYWLENVQVTGHSKPPADKPATSLHIPTPGEEVPDFKLINQDGKQISLHQYRGQTLLLTMIYTRFPPSTASSAPTPRATAKRICSASASIPLMTRPKFCAPTLSRPPAARIKIQASLIGSSPPSRPPSCRKSLIISR